MKKRSWLAMLAAALSMAIATGCGGDDTIGGKLVDEFKGDSNHNGNQTATATGTSGSSQSASPSGSNNGGDPSPSHASESLTGTWSGKAGTGQTRTVMQLVQSGTSLSGSWMWGAHDTRHCKGYRSGNQVVLKDTRSDGDTWTLTLSSDRTSLSGTGKKYGGGSYAVNFSR